MAEIVKHAVIADPVLFQLLENLDHHVLQGLWHEVLVRAIAVKMRFVETDVNENGPRAALNFGHTFGHALESWSLTTDDPLLHGECVAQGMILETWLSHFHLGVPDRAVCQRITNLIQRHTPVHIDRSIRFSELEPFLVADKKHRGGIPRFSLITQIGRVEIGQVVDAPVIAELISDTEVMQAIPWLKG
jgi:3-dehydroquinate synthase